MLQFVSNLYSYYQISNSLSIIEYLRVIINTFYVTLLVIVQRINRAQLHTASALTTITWK